MKSAPPPPAATRPIMPALASVPSSFEVLFYKRKVNGSYKNVSKMDGLLKIQWETQHVKLMNADSDTDATSTPVFSGRVHDISKQYEGLQPENNDNNNSNCLLVGGYFVEIVSEFNHKHQTKVNAPAMSSLPPASSTGVGYMTKKRKFTIPISSKPKVTSGSTASTSYPNIIRRIRPAQPRIITVPPTDDSRTKTLCLAPKTAPPSTLLQSRAAHSTKAPPFPKISTTVCSRTIVLPHIPLPQSIRTALRPHQIEGVDFLWKALHDIKGACLADEMGLGKTLMTISILCAFHRERRNSSSIVVCPSSLVQNWAQEFDKWIGKTQQPKRVIVRKGGQDEGLRELRSFCSSLKTNMPGQVLIISYDLLRMNVRVFQELNSSTGNPLALLVADEAHRLKNTSGSQTLSALQELPADARLCITATPIQNNLKEFWSLANFCCPGIFGDLFAFSKDFERPIQASNKKGATVQERSRGQEQSQVLGEITQKFMLRRLQKDVLKSMLPPRNEFLIFCRPSVEQENIYLETTKDVSLSYSNTADALNKLMTLRKLCAHPYLLHVDKFKKITNQEVRLSGKLSFLDCLLRNIRIHAPEDKIVVVSNFTSVLSVVETSILRPNDMTFLRLDGTTETSKRQDIVDSFNRTSSKHSFCLLLSSKAGGCGLNLVGASRLVLVDADWNPAVDVQAMGRIYRQGQTKQCMIYRLFATGTLEEVIYQRQAQKENLSNLTFDGKAGKNSEGRFTPEELADCFALKTGTVCETKRKLGSKWPEYIGPSTLHLLECQDKPLIETTEMMESVVSHIHLVDDNDPCGSSTMIPIVERDNEMTASTYHSESEQEYEF